ncbi:MAG: DNA polymerase III subunit delta' [Paludibacter sp.]|nr:DNA polymerase III subunit delta' [Paludibacter sp.]
MLFSQIIGHQQIKQRFIQSVTEQRIAHAQLISGREGIGKLHLALAYAQYISCTNRTESDSCGVCPSCVKYAKLAHPDLHFAFPYIKPEGSKTWICNDFLPKFREMILNNEYFGFDDWLDFSSDGSKKQGYIFANESEEIIRKLNLKSYESEYKIMLIWLPEKMYGDVVANKILKILEEPPEKTVFLLVSNQPNLLLPTIISRTQPVYVPPLAESEIAAALLVNENFNLTEQNALRIAHIANGSLLDAFKIAANDEENAANFERFTSLMRYAWCVGAKKKYSALKELRVWADEISAANVGREQQKKFLNYALQMVRENYIFNLSQPQINYLTATEENFAKNFSRFINEKNVEKMMDEFSLAQRQINQNANAKIVFFDIALKMIMMLK